ncbi:MAG: hypothetical protein AAGG51_14370 [Cyanobacteria bacterium P01_G01_bin.54]
MDSLDNLESLTKIIQSVITSLGLLIGGIWAYFKFLKGRIYQPRMELSVDCEVYSQQDSPARLQIKAVLRNLGLSRINIDSESSGIRIYKALERTAIDSMPADALESEWVRIGTFSVFDGQNWIDSSEKIRSEKIIECNSRGMTFKVDIIVMSDDQQWYSSCVSISNSTINL